MSTWSYRLAEPKDAESFAKWAVDNPQISRRDIGEGLGKTHPTTLVFVAEKDGVPMLFAPLRLSAMLAYLVPNPESRASEKLQAMDGIKDVVMAFMVQYGVREILTLTQPEYGVAKWALAHGFEEEPRKLLRLDLNKEMTVTPVCE